MQITDAQFEQEVLNATGVVLVDLWASWCPPCKMMEPMIHRLAEEKPAGAKVVAINIDRNPATAAAYNIASVPTFIVFENGEIVGRRTGAATERQLREMIEQATNRRSAA